MIRNYYTEAYKGGIVPAISGDNLIDGRAKIVQSIPSGNHNAMTATSRVVTLATVVAGIERNMFATAPAGGGQLAWTINDAMLIESVVYTATTTVITFTTAKAIAVNTVITFFSVNQSSWNEYNLFIGSSPANFQSGVGAKVTQGIADAGTAGTTLEIKTANALVAAGQLIYDDGVLIGTVVSVAANDTTITTSAIPVVADLSVINFVNPSPASVSVLTASNQTMTFVNPAEGFVLPVSVVQVTAVANGLDNLIALD
jgi:hypothetical protein